MTEHLHTNHEDQPGEAVKSCCHGIGFWQTWATPMAIVLAGVIIAGAMLYNAKVQTRATLENANNLLGTAVQQKAAPSQAQVQQAPAKPTGPVTVASRSNEPTLGSKSAKVTIIEFGDFQCPYCKQFYSQTFKGIKTKYIDTGKVKYIFRHFPLSFHSNAQISAVAAECANQQGKFWQYHDILYTDGSGDGSGLASADLKKYADQLGLNKGTLGFGSNKFNQCLDANSTLDIVKNDAAEGAKDGITGTPSFFINGTLVVGAQPAASFEQAIEAALKK